MKKHNGMMYPRHKSTARKTVKCCVCGKSLTPAEAYYDVDGDNYAITRSAPPYCVDCKDKRQATKTSERTAP